MKNTVKLSNEKRTEESPSRPAGNDLALSMNNASIDSMVALDNIFRVTAWNDTAAQWSGIPCEEAIGKNLFSLFPAAAANQTLTDALRHALQGFKSFLPATGELYVPGHFETHIVPLRDASGNIYGILQIMHDVAHRLRAENELRELNLQLARQYNALRAANEELAVFAKVAAHDLKEPLRKIYTFAELIMMHEAKKLSDSGRGNFRRIQTSVQRMGLLTDDIVSYTSLSHSGPKEDVDLNVMVDKVNEMFASEHDTNAAEIEFGPLPVIQGYPDAVLQMLRQLVDNALKFRRPGVAPLPRIACHTAKGIDVSHEEAEPGGSYQVLSVSDNGIGFDPEYRKRIFELFQRLHTDKSFRGNGVGLAIAQKAARLHGGFITADSVPGEGSTFRCYFPA